MTITNPAAGREAARQLPPTVPVRGRRPVVPVLVLLVAAGLAVGVVAGLGWFTAQLPGWWTTVGPDYVHTARDDAEDHVCNTLAMTYDQGRCVLYLAEDDVTEARRTPRADGGVCPLATRLACARLYGLEPRDGDVPVWRPWDLHNGAAGTAFNAAAGAVLGLVVAGTAAALGGPRRRGWLRLLATGAGSAVAGAVAAVTLFTLDRHPLSAGSVPALPVWAAPAVAVAVVAIVAVRDRRSGGAR
jgi:hypothetical protein